MRTKNGETFIDGRVYTRLDDSGGFDELIAYAPQVHLEMMDDKTLWIGLSYADLVGEVHVTVSARGKLSINVQEA